MAATESAKCSLMYRLAHIVRCGEVIDLRMEEIIHVERLFGKDPFELIVEWSVYEITTDIGADR